MTKIKTTELPLATKLYKENAKSLDGIEVIVVRGKPVVRFEFTVDSVDVIDEFRSGSDGIQSYETCRRMLLRMIDIEIAQHGTKDGGK